MGVNILYYTLENSLPISNVAWFILLPSVVYPLLVSQRLEFYSFYRINSGGCNFEILFMFEKFLIGCCFEWLYTHFFIRV